MQSNLGFIATADILDEDDMASNADNKVASQQSIKAYVDANGGGGASAINDLSDGKTSTYSLFLG